MTSRDSESPIQPWWRRYSEHRFSILLVVLISLLAGPTLSEGLGYPIRWYDLFMAILMLAAILSLCFETYQRLFALVLGIPTICFVVAGNLLTGSVSAFATLFSPTM
jgi:hypothetical protein